jgi:CRP/FNR family transcriptional regulator, cyclic AMP receptor protein
MTTEVPLFPGAPGPEPGAAARRLLKRNALFSGLPDAVLDRIAAHAQWRSCRRNETLFSQGDQGDALFGVVSGRVRISTVGPDGREVFLNIMEPGDTFGEIAVIDGLPRTAGAVALDPATLIFIRREEFLAVVEREPVLAMHLLRLFCKRVRWTSDLVEESSFLFGPARLAKRLLVLTALHGEAGPEGMELAISQAELAQFLNMSRQLVNQQLQAWRSRGWVSLGRSRIVVRDAEALGREAEATANGAVR